MSAGNVFRSRIRPITYLFIMSPSLFTLRIFTDDIIDGDGTVPLIIVVSVPLILFSIAVLARARYTFTETGLKIDEIGNKEEIQYSSIMGAENTTDVFGVVSLIITYAVSPYKTGQTRITPAKNEEFITQLSQRSPELKQEIYKLVTEDRTYAEWDIYKTKISRAYKYGIMAGLCVALFSLFGILLFRDDGSTQEAFIILFVVLFIFVLIFLPIVALARKKIRYTFTKDGLLIESVFRYSRMVINYETITSVTEMRSLGAILNNAYGISADVIKIEHNCGEASILISPEKKEEFLTKLSSRLPDPKIIVRRGGKAA